MRRLILFIVAAAGMLAGRPALAGSGLDRIDVNGSLFLFSRTQSPGETLTISTSNLSPSTADTVIHVQSLDGPAALFVAGNDDYSGLSSRVVVPALSTARSLEIIVRAFNSGSGGTCDITVDSSISGPSTFSAMRFGGSLYSLNSLGDASHVITAELPGGTSTANGSLLSGARDTVLLVIDTNTPERAGHAITFNDDDGVGFMSWARTPQACGASGAGCFAVVANFSDSSTTTTNLIWDEDAEHFDSDGDGLGDSLERFIGTGWNPGVAQQDTDQDGISDSWEVLGVEPSSGPPIKFPLMGANPVIKDIFIEADWLQCTSNCDAKLGMDTYQVQVGDALQYATDLAPVRVHVDNGIANADPNTWYLANDWGGGHRLATAASPWCDEFSPERVGTFHHMTAFDTGGHGAIGGTCFGSARADRLAVHELGHNLFLDHGGRPGVIDLNAKPHYFSMMNYGYEGDPGNVPNFSHGSFTAALNPTTMNERSNPGFSQSILTALQSSSEWGYKVDVVNGFVDWDRDGDFAASGTTTRAAITCTPGRDDNSCDLYGASYFKSSVFTDVSLAWQKGVGGSIGDRLLMFGRNSGGVPVYKSALKSTMNTACGSFASYDGSNSNCAGMSLSASSAGPPSGATPFAPAIASLGNNKMLVIVADSNKRLRSYTLTTSTSGVDTWGPSQSLPNSIVISGDPAAIGTGTNQADIWAPSGGRLKKWTYNNGYSTNSVDEVWSDGSLISPTQGIGVTMGYQDNSTTKHEYAAIPVTGDFFQGQIEIAFRDTAGKWNKIANAWDIIPGAAFTKARPALAYVQKPGSPVQVGRFYLAFQDIDNGPGQPKLSRMSMTEGNLTGTATTKRFVFNLPTVLSGPLNGGVALAYDPAVDTNVRMAFTNSANNSYFAPLADGIINAAVKDLDDWQYIKNAERASLGLETLSLP
jgi:hypothetical protein